MTRRYGRVGKKANLRTVTPQSEMTAQGLRTITEMQDQQGHPQPGVVWIKGPDGQMRPHRIQYK